MIHLPRVLFAPSRKAHDLFLSQRFFRFCIFASQRQCALSTARQCLA